MMNKVVNKFKTVGIFETIKWGIRGAYNKTVKVCVLTYFPKYKQGNLDFFKKTIKEKISNEKNVYIFAGVPFYDIGGGQRSAQLAKVFSKLKYNVFYFYTYDTNSKIFDMEIPTVMHKYLGAFSTKHFNELVKSNDICIFEFPSKKMLPYLNIAYKHNAKIVYENIDNWETNLGGSNFNEYALKELLNKASIITGTAKPLVEQIYMYFEKYGIKGKKVLYSPNAVNNELFNPDTKYSKPDDLIIGEKTLIYYGSLWGSWFDWNLIFDVAKKHSEFSINLIGDYKDIKDIVEKSPQNVHYLGLKKQSDLPAYLTYSDIALLPFKVDEIGLYVSPVKIFEYISMNKIILATPLPDITGYPNTFTGITSKEWMDILNKNLKPDKSSRDKFITDNNWHNRCINIIKKIN